MSHRTVPRPPEPAPIRLRDRVLVPPAPRDTSVITGFPARVAERLMVRVPDPRSGRATPVAVWHYPTTGPRGAPVVMVHGFRGDHHGLALVADCLPDTEIYAPELPGFGHSPAFPDAEHTVATYATAVQCALGALGLVPPGAADRQNGSTGRRTAGPAAVERRPTLLGHSFGSVVAAHLAADDPQRWAELVLLNPICEPALSADGSLLERGLTRIAQGYYELAAALPERAGMALLSSPLVVWITGTVMARTPDRNTLAYLHDQHQRYFSAFDTRRVLVEAYRASITGTVAEVADRLALPVALVAGAQDEFGSVPAQRQLARRIGTASPCVELRVLEGVGHLIHYERAPEAARLVAALRNRAAAHTAAAHAAQPHHRP